MKIARTSTDSVWTLTQTITQMPGDSPFIKIAMALKNNTAQQRTVHPLCRCGPSMACSATVELMLENATSVTFPHQAFAQETFFPPPFPCDPLDIVPPGPILGFDGSLVMACQSVVHAHSAVTTTMIYRGG